MQNTYIDQRLCIFFTQILKTVIIFLLIGQNTLFEGVDFK